MQTPSPIIGAIVIIFIISVALREAKASDNKLGYEIALCRPGLTALRIGFDFHNISPHLSHWGSITAPNGAQYYLSPVSYQLQETSVAGGGCATRIELATRNLLGPRSTTELRTPFSPLPSLLAGGLG